ncbi:hypothetical protein WICMUC_004235 [Wickerhamomyces mucosus]|uniref:DOCKER domain-containing protein n=1 Tax=Wickerhamomyces mucosus TaxID=1378264 RepID=A0A9P8PJ80_9ASCO|nr:hypothetical protein WICMUC_004235 [Wickerhamomyces mucosus]
MSDYQAQEKLQAKAEPHWNQLPMMIHGKIIKPFTPLDKHPSLKLTAPFIKNLYYGDEVFLFESNDENWCRGYLIVQPLPVDFIAKSSDLEKLPELTVDIVIVPLSHVKKLGRFPLASNFSPPDPKDFEHSDSIVPSINELQYKDSGSNQHEIKLKPPLPLIRLESGDLLDELIPSINQLASHIFSLYSVAEYTLFTKLYTLFEELNDLRLKLLKKLLTKNESILAKKRIALLLTNISKLLSSKGQNRFDKTSQILKTDPSGFETIMARDIYSGELYNYQHEDISKQPIPKFIVGNQIASALSPNFPVHNTLEQDMTPSRKNKFDKVIPSQILVDFKDVSGTSTLNPKGFIGMTAYLYLRTAKRRLTEAFAIHITASSDFSLDKISAALFRNIPGTEVDSNRIYLVAIVTERIQLPSNTSTLDFYRKGIAAGVTDISRIFSRHKGALESGQAHEFIIKLFGSYVNKDDNTTLDPTNMNFGWGELIDRIIKGSNKGVAINPRAEKLIVSIKEFKDDLQRVELGFEHSIKTPINQIRTNFFDPLVKPHDRIYFTLGKVNLIKNSGFPGDLVTIQLINEDPISKVGISKATNESVGKFWNFTSVYSNEVIGETIKVSSIDHPRSNENLTLKLFVNGVFKSSLEVLIFNKGLVHEYDKNKLLNFADRNTGEVIGSVEITTEYIGKTFNIESSTQHILNFEKLYKIPENEMNLIDTLKLLNQTNLKQSIKFFKQLIPKILKIFQIAVEENLEKLKFASFYAFIHLLDVVIARQEQYTYLYHEFVAEIEQYSIPKVGLEFLKLTTEYFNNAESGWNYVGRTLCRTLTLLVKISTLAVAQGELRDVQEAFHNLVIALKLFLELNVEKNVPDQLLVLENYDLILNNLHNDRIFTNDECIEFAVDLINSIKTASSPLSDGNITRNSNSNLKSREVRFLITKLLLIRRFLNSWVFDFEELPKSSISFYYHAINWAIECYDLSNFDMESLRLANSCLVSLCSISWTILVKGQSANYVLPRNISRLMLKVAQIFTKFHQFTRSNEYFEPKRVYTQIFPNSYPFNELIIDSIVNDVVLVEILVELSVVYSFISKVARAYLDVSDLSTNQGVISIIQASQSDILFNESPFFFQELSKDDLLAIVQTNRLLVQGKFFPSEKWISMYSLVIEATTSTSELIKFLMIRDHIPQVSESQIFDRSLWSKYLKSMLAMAGSMPASICHLAEVPRKSAYKITSDIRSRCALVINQCWDCLGWDSLNRDYVRFQFKRSGGYHSEFIQDDYGILEELIVFCLQRNSLCQIVGVKILWTIMIAEILVQESIEASSDDEQLGNKLAEVERGCFIGLDKFFKSNRYIPGLYEQGNFITRLKMCVRLDPEDISFNDVHNFIINLSEFLEIQYDLSSVPNGEEFDDERTFHQLDIARHLMRVSNSKKFNSSLDDLFQSNILKEKYVQAALCLELMASTLEWNVDDILPISIKPKFPAHSSFERKEALYKNIAKFLVKGKKYEKAVLIYKELANAYDKINFDLKGLSFVHENLSKLYVLLESADRETPTYFKVSFIGLAFPNTLRSRSFIYEGLPFEHINSIHNRLLRLHTGSKIISDDDEFLKDPSISPPGKFLHIVTVKPQMDFNNSHGNLSTAARLYMQNKSLKYFTTSRRLQKSTSILNLWVEETTYETYNYFPTLMNRSEIYQVSTVKLSPIQNALRTLTEKIRDLVNLEASAQKAINSNDLDSFNFNSLSRNLSGTVDSPVNGGIGQYKEFFTQRVIIDNEEEFEEYENDLQLLRNSFDNLSICIFRCLLVHGALIPYSYRESHIALIELFEKNFSEEVTRTNLSIQDLKDSLASISSSSSPTSSLHKVPSISSTIVSSPGPANSSRSISGISLATSNIYPSNYSTLSRTETKGSDKSSTKGPLSTTTTNKSNNSGRMRSILKWRQSRAPDL